MAVTTAPTVPEWPSYGNFCMVTQNPHFLKKWKGGTKENFSKLPKKTPRLKGRKGFWRKWLYPLFSMHLKSKDWERFWRKSGSKSAGMANLWQISQGHPKPAFSVKAQTGDQGKFLKNRPKSSPRLKGPKALWRKRHYPLISIHLKWNDRKRLRRKQRLQKCKNGQVIGIFVRSPKTLIF